MTSTTQSNDTITALLHAATAAGRQTTAAAAAAEADANQLQLILIVLTAEGVAVDKQLLQLRQPAQLGG